VTFRALVLVSLLIIVTSAIEMHAGQSPGAVPPTPSAVVSGVVVDLSTRTPVRFALVRIGLADSRSIDRTTTADADGRFEFSGMTAGTYALSASSPQYLPSTFGQRRWGGPGTPVEIADGETRNDITIAMMRGGVISGRVLDDYGDPVPGLQVLAMRAAFDDGGLMLGVAMPSRTDDRGSFRLFMLQPGQYYVFAQQSPSSTLGAHLAAGPVSTFYPGSAEAAGAEPVTVLAGRETSGIDITLVSTKVARVRGRALMSTGAPFAGGSVVVHSRFGRTMSTHAGGTVKRDGTFELLGVAPGQYVLSVQPAGNRAGDDVEVGRTEIAVAGDDIDNVSIIGVRGSVVRGTIRTETGERLPLAPALLTVRPMPAADERGGLMSPAPVDDEYGFELKHLSGRHTLDVEIAGLPPQWGIKKIRWAGEDVTYTPFEFRGQSIEGVEIVLSDRWATLSGVVRDTAGRAVDDAALVLFPVDETLRIPGSRYIRGFRSDRLGRFGISWLLPGEYLLASARDMQPSQWNDLTFLKSLADSAARFTLGEDDEREIDLRVRSPR
jgi:hypothetical protein